jgi:hypothetical protein
MGGGKEFWRARIDAGRFPRALPDYCRCLAPWQLETLRHLGMRSLITMHAPVQNGAPSPGTVAVRVGRNTQTDTNNLRRSQRGSIQLSSRFWPSRPRPVPAQMFETSNAGYMALMMAIAHCEETKEERLLPM